MRLEKENTLNEKMFYIFKCCSTSQFPLLNNFITRHNKLLQIDIEKQRAKNKILFKKNSSYKYTLKV